jgi:tetratricopeptide (TPR) repeat protein
LTHQITDAAPKPVDAASKRACLASILASPEFAGADRLKDFLRYVVEVDLEGGASHLRAKVIAADVYSRAAGDADAEALVRVDAGRLRRRLDLYYAGTGAGAPLRLHIDRGGYAPRFAPQEPEAVAAIPETTTGETTSVGAPMLVWPAIGVLSALCLGLMVLSAYLWFGPGNAATPPERATTPSPDMMTRLVLFEENPARLQALNLVEQGRGLLLPAPDLSRLESALGLFAQATRLDPDHAGGYAGTALATALMGAVMPPGNARDATLETSELAAAEAIRRGPTDPMSLTAQAMAAFARHDDAVARDRIAKAVSLAPDDVHVRDYQGLILLFIGDLDNTLVATDPDFHMSRPFQRLGWRNARATALFLSDQPEAAIDLLTESAALGDPISVINHAVLAASYQASGQTQAARATVERFERAWPDDDIGGLLTRLFRDPAHADKILVALRQAGWG